MKAQITFTQKLLYMTFLFIGFVAFNPMYGQTKDATAERTVKGVVSNEDGPLEKVSVVLKDSNVGVVTDAEGKFTFPQALKPGDVLVISYLGYEIKEQEIKADTYFIRTLLAEEAVEIMGSLNSNKRFKSKRKKQ